MTNKIIRKIFPSLDDFYRNIDKGYIRRTKNIKLIPNYSDRVGGKLSYAEWAHVAGIFQTLIYQNVKSKSGNNVLDVGCGAGILGISAQPSVSEGGTYTGIDIGKEHVDFCTKHYNAPNYNFVHFDVSNASYTGTAEQSTDSKPWPLKDNDYDLITALSVWTHFQEKDANYYLKEVHRVLKSGGRAIITFFHLDDHYESSMNKRDKAQSDFHSTKPNKWIFDVETEQSKEYLTAKWVKCPEDAIAITKPALDDLIANSGLKLVEYYPGNWKEIPGVYFQDVLIFEKP